MFQSLLSFHHWNEIIAENPCAVLFLFCVVLCFQLREILIFLISSPHYISIVINEQENETVSQKGSFVKMEVRALKYCI